jgi:hypothetical protein
MRMPQSNAADFIELVKNSSFLDRKPTSAVNETVDDH